MQVILDILSTATFDLTRGLMAGLVLLLIPTLYFFTSRVRAMIKSGKPIALRRIPAYDDLNLAMGKAAESGQPMHVSLGTGGIGNATTAESMAGLMLLDQLAQKAAMYDAQPIVTTADPTLMLAAQDRMRLAYARRGFAKGYDASKVRLIAPDRTAYAAGVIDLLDNEPLSGNVMLGAFGDEYLLLGEASAQRGLTQVAGAADPQVAAFVLATADKPLLGEEIFTAGAYLGRQPVHIGSLLAQDWVRLLVIIIIVAGVVVKSLV